MNKKNLLIACFSVLTVFGVSCGSDSTSSDTTKVEDKPEDVVCASLPDADGDTIADVEEGRSEERDSDGDGTPDYMDLDSDNDTIPDKLEADNGNCSANPAGDAIGVGIPNYLNDDSDGNGILDRDECCGKDEACLNARDANGLFTYCVDTDGDTVPDFIDDDNDGDGIDDASEITGLNDGTLDSISIHAFYGDCDGDGEADAKGNVDSPVDCDSDTIPDCMDLDSDGDGVSDLIEGETRIGSWYARYSQDSDGNGIPDSEECGAGASKGSCVDTDGDGIPDVLDPDNDGDGLSDIDELNVYKTDMNSMDTDGDGVYDYVEIALGTNPSDKADNPQANGDFVFIVPYKGETTPKRQAMSFSTSVQVVDLYFSIDQSGSMSGEIRTLQRKIPSMIASMQCADLNRKCDENKDCADLNGGNSICSENGRCIEDPKYGKDGEGCFDDMWTGVGWWGNLNRFRNGSSLNPDPKVTARALGQVPGLGASENNIQPAACALMGPGECNSPMNALNCYNGADMNERLGCVGFRKRAIKIYLQAGDEANYEDAKFSVANAAYVGNILKESRVRYVGLWGVSIESRPYDALDNGIKQLACEAGSCAAGENCAADCQNITQSELDGLFLTQIVDESIEPKTIEIVRKLTRQMKLHITSGAEDIDVPDVSKLVAGMNINLTDKVVNGRTCMTVQGDKAVPFEGIDKLEPGTNVCYDVIPVEAQDIFPPKSEPQLLKARVKVMGDGATLNSGTAYFVVPPVLIDERIN